MTLPTPFSYTQFDGDGSETSFSFTWDYINKSHVHVYLDDEEVSQGTGDAQWQFDGDKKIVMGTAPTAEQKLTIRRETPEDDQIVDWLDVSHLIADDLNTSNKQWLFLIQEHHDMLMRIIYGLAPIPGPDLPDDLFGLWNRLARHDDSDKDTDDEKAQTIDSVDQLAGDATSAVQNGVDSYVLTFGAISERLDLIQGDGANYPGDGNPGHLGKFRVNDDNKLFYWNQTAATPAWVEIVGGQGVPGAAATVDVGTTTTGAAGTNASVTNSGTNSAAIFDFTIPRGANGTNGNDGVTPDVSVGETTTGAAGTDASVTNTGEAPNVVLNFTIPRGADGTGAGTVTNVQAGNGINVADGTSTPTVSAVAGDNTITVDGDGIKVNTANLPAGVQSNWTEEDDTSAAFIQNKPDIPDAQVQSNWTEEDDTAVSFIQNKPDIPGAIAQGAGLTETDNTASVDWRAQRLA